MTREEAYKYNKTMSVTIPSVDRLIDMIFDDFESKTCETCRYYILCDDEYNYCDAESSLNGFVHKDFGCNKWESK